VKARGLCTRDYQRRRNDGSLARRWPKWTPVVASAPQPVVFGSPLMPERFWEKIVVTEDGCWRWTGAKHTGYGVMRIDYQARALHLVTYEVFIGPRPAGTEADHTCHSLDPSCYLGRLCPHRACCMPLCLEFVEPAENRRRQHQWKPKRVSCPAGHPYAPPHVYYDRHGYPDCGTCRRARWRARYWSNKQIYGTGRRRLAVTASST
jgi:hypothetical protein